MRCFLIGNPDAELIEAARHEDKSILAERLAELAETDNVLRTFLDMVAESGLRICPLLRKDMQTLELHW
jgi:hypothetical protein